MALIRVHLHTLPFHESRSMGGLLAADSVYAFIHTRPDTDAPLWPNVVACLAFDTPVITLIFC